MNARHFDVHARLTPRPGARTALLTAMDRCSVERAAVCSGGVIDLDRLARQVMVGGHIESDADNDAVLDGCRGSGGRLVPFYFGNPHRSAERYQQQASGFHGLEISPAVHGVALTDERCLALVEVAAEFGHPVYVVCLARPGIDATALVTLAAAFPETPFVLGHCGFVGIDLYSLDVVAAQRNVLAETSGAYAAVVAAAIERLGADRVLFGTEYPIQQPQVELAKLRSLDLAPSVWRQVTAGNAGRLLDATEPLPAPTAKEPRHA